jgi:5-formyltetrahydrofolate cyclo-ligase
MTDSPGHNEDEKGRLRRMLLQKRRTLGRDARIEKSRKILQFLQQLPQFTTARMVHCYVSIERENEVDTSSVIEWLSSVRKEVFVPYIERGEMVSSRYRNGQRFIHGKQGFPVPEMPAVSGEDRFDIVLVPLVGFDCQGFRLGYGKGHYDRFFRHLARKGRFPERIGLAFQLQCAPRIPSDPWDERLDLVVTENGVLDCKKT